MLPAWLASSLRFPWRYNPVMKFRLASGVMLLCTFCCAQGKFASIPASVTVPAIIDHNRVIIDVDLPLPDGSTQRVHAWVDNGDADLEMSRHLATILGLQVSCDNRACTSPSPREIMFGELRVSLSDLKEAKIPLKPVNGASVLAPGVNAEINLPAALLRHFDVLVDYPGHKFTIGPPGSIRFLGQSSKVQINPENGLIQIPAQVENRKYSLALDLGSCISFLSPELFDKLAAAHSEWPHMTGAVGSANMWGGNDETKWPVMRIERVHYGPLFLTDVPFVEFPKDWMDFFEKRAGISTAGLLGAQALLNYRVGLDYTHSTVYFDIGRLFNFPDFDVVGLTLRPEDDGRYTIMGMADFEGRPSALQGTAGVEAGDHLAAVDDIPVRGSTMGQVWSMLGGTPGQQRSLTIERDGKQFTVEATVQRFLAPVPDSEGAKTKKK